MGELFQAPQQTFTVGLRGDPCSINGPPWSANAAVNANAAQVKAICETLMTPPGAVAFYGTAANGRTPDSTLAS